jgi:hypothetical protein
MATLNPAERFCAQLPAQDDREDEEFPYGEEEDPEEELSPAMRLCAQLRAHDAQLAREDEEFPYGEDEDPEEELSPAMRLCAQLRAHDAQLDREEGQACEHLLRAEIAAEEERAREQDQEQDMASEMEQLSDPEWDAPLMDDEDANYDRCGTWGCLLPEKHSGLHQTAEPEGRRPRNPVLRYGYLQRTVPQQPNLAARRASVAALHRAEVAAEDEAEGLGAQEIDDDAVGDLPGVARSAVSGSASEASGLQQRPRPTFEASSVVLNPTHSCQERKNTPTYVENSDKRLLKGGHLKVGTRLEDINAFSTHAQWLLHGIPFSDLISQQPPITNHDKIVRILQQNPWCWDFVDAEDDARGAKPFDNVHPETLTERQSKSLFGLCLGIYSDWDNQINVSKLPMEQQPYEPSIWVCDAAFLWNKSRSICALCNEEMTLAADDSRYPKANPDAVRTPCPNKATLERKWRQLLHVPSNVIACIHHRCQHLTNVARPGVPPTPARLGGPVAYWADAIQVIQAQGHSGAPRQYEITISTVTRRAKSRLKEEGVAPCPRLPGANGKRPAYPKCLCPWHMRLNALQEVIASEFGQQLKELRRAFTAKYNRKRPQTSDSDASEVEEAGDGPRVRPRARAAVNLMTEGEMDTALEKTLNELFPDHDDVPFELVYMTLTRMEPRAALAGGKAVEETLIRLEDARRICPFRSHLLRIRAGDL